MIEKDSIYRLSQAAIELIASKRVSRMKKFFRDITMIEKDSILTQKIILSACLLHKSTQKK